jgi:hypothetical protein
LDKRKWNLVSERVFWGGMRYVAFSDVERRVGVNVMLDRSDGVGASAEVVCKTSGFAGGGDVEVVGGMGTIAVAVVGAGASIASALGGVTKDTTFLTVDFFASRLMAGAGGITGSASGRPALFAIEPGPREARSIPKIGTTLGLEGTAWEQESLGGLAIGPRIKSLAVGLVMSRWAGGCALS